MYTFGYSMLVLLPFGIGLVVLLVGSRWQRRQWEMDRANAAIMSRGVDASLGLVLLPPIRLEPAAAARLRDEAARRGLVLQAHVRNILSTPPTPSTSDGS